MFRSITFSAKCSEYGMDALRPASCFFLCFSTIDFLYNLSSFISVMELAEMS